MPGQSSRPRCWRTSAAPSVARTVQLMASGLSGLMAWMGHDDVRAALIYQRATQEAAERIARGLSDLADRHRAQGENDDENPDDGAAGSLVPTG